MEVISIRRAYKLAADSPCSRFWISEGRACEVIKRMLKGEDAAHIAHGHGGRWSKTPSHALLQEQYTDLFKQYKVVSAENPKCTFSEKVFLTIISPAPKFYITFKTAQNFICRYRKSMTIMERLRRHADIRINP